MELKRADGCIGRAKEHRRVEGTSLQPDGVGTSLRAREGRLPSPGCGYLDLEGPEESGRHRSLAFRRFPFCLYWIRATGTIEVSILSLIWDGLIWAGCRPRSERESLSARRGPRGSNTHDKDLGRAGTPCGVLVNVSLTRLAPFSVTVGGALVWGTSP